MQEDKKLTKGSLEVICGSMFSGKTEELMKRLRRAEYAKQNVLTIKHKIDIRGRHAYITSHDGRERFAFSVENKNESLEKILDLANKNISVVGLDELHFFPKSVVPVMMKLVESGKRVITSGLDLDFRGEPFEQMSLALSLADRVTKLKAICMKCGKDAHHTQRVIDGKPADYNDPIILVGAKEFYEARCRDCFQINKPGESQAKDESKFMDVKSFRQTQV